MVEAPRFGGLAVRREDELPSASGRCKLLLWKNPAPPPDADSPCRSINAAMASFADAQMVDSRYVGNSVSMTGYMYEIE